MTLSPSAPVAIRRRVAALVRDAGWRSGSDLEDRASLLMIRWGVAGCVQQFRVGRYRLDFAFPDVMIAVEVDGWHHGRPDTILRDGERDRWLRDRGWTVLRVDDGASFADRLNEAVIIVKARREWRAGPPSWGRELEEVGDVARRNPRRGRVFLRASAAGDGPVCLSLADELEEVGDVAAGS